MNEELTPDERAAMRSRIVGGARDIKPAGAHRNAWIAGSIAAVLVVAIAGGAVATSTLSAPQIANSPSPTATVARVTPTPTPTHTSTPTPTSTPTATPPPPPAPSTPVVAFNGDCGQMLNDADLSELVVGGPGRLYTEPGLGTNVESSLALLGGLSCTWIGNQDSVSVVVAAPSAVAPDLTASMASVTCSVDRGCATGRVVEDLWVGVLVSATAGDYDAGFTPAEVSAASARLDRVISRVAAKPHASPVASFGSVQSDGWVLSDCVALKGRLESITGVSLEIQVPPGAYLNPTRPVESLLASSAGVSTCDFREPAYGSIEMIEVTLMPGASAPPASALAVAGTSETSVPGADRAWVLVDPNGSYSRDVVAVVNDNRLLVRRFTGSAAGMDADRIAAAVLESLR